MSRIRYHLRKAAMGAAIIGAFATFGTGPAGWKWLYWVFLPLALYITLTPGGWLAVAFGLWAGRR